MVGVVKVGVIIVTEIASAATDTAPEAASAATEATPEVVAAATEAATEAAPHLVISMCVSAVRI